MTNPAFVPLLLALVFTLSGCAGKKEPTARPSESSPSGRPKLGISILPQGQVSEWNDASFTEAYQKAREGGFSVAVWRHQWGEIEPLLAAWVNLQTWPASSSSWPRSKPAG